MKVQHFAISRTETESLYEFFAKIATELGSLEQSGTKVVDIVFAPRGVLDPAHSETITVYFEGQDDMSVIKTTTMDRTLFKTPAAENSSSALLDGVEQLSQWAKRNPSADIYDVSISLGLDPQGDESGEIRVYSSNS